MLKTIELKNIKSNPFNARSEYAQEPIDELAKEIKQSGFWSGSLRGREVENGKIELCFGHRRLLALKKLGRKEIQIDVIDLTDEEIAEQGLVENLQRQGLNDMEKAEGIKRFIELLMSKNGGDKAAAYERAEIMLGVRADWIREFISITEFPAPIKKLVSDKKIAVRTALEAHRFGDQQMVKTVAKNKMPLHTIAKLSQTLKHIPDEKVREKIKAKIVSGEIIDPKEVEKRAEPMLRAKAQKGNPPPDLLIVVARWTHSIEDWRKALREVIPYRDYLDTSPKLAKDFRDEVRGLIGELEKLL